MFIYGLLHNAVSSLNCIALKYRATNERIVHGGLI